MGKLIDLNGLGHFKIRENAMVASDYYATQTYAVGDYVYYNGTLYKCKTAITTAEAWTAAHWTAAKIGDDVTELKTALTQQQSVITEVQDIFGFDIVTSGALPHGSAIAAGTSHVNFNAKQGWNVTIGIEDSANPSANYFCYVKYVGESNPTNIGRLTSGNSLSIVAAKDTEWVGFYLEGLQSGTINVTVTANSGNDLVEDVDGKVDKSGTKQVTSKNLNDITSNVLFSADSVTVSGTGSYVNQVIHTYSGTIKVGDIFKINASSVDGATSALNSPYAIYLRDSDDENVRTSQFDNIEITQSDITAGVEEVVFLLYPAKGTKLPTGSATYNNLEILRGEEAEYTTTGILYQAIRNTIGNVTENIPDYYFTNDYLESKANRIAEVSKTCAGNGDVFLFITDEHFDFGYNQKHSPDLIAYLNSKVNIPRLFNGGDTANGLSIEFVDDLRNLYPHKIHNVMGNHDWMLNRSGDYLAYYCDSFAYNQVGYADKHYYYVDNEQKKIRYIVLNAWKSDLSQNNVLVTAYDQEQLQWFTSVALDVESGWGIIIFTHYIKVGTNIAPDGALAFLNAIDNYSGNGEIICIVEGHTHFDSISHTNGGIPIINTTSDKNGVWYDGDTPMDGWLAERVSGTVYEQAFDVMCVNRTERKITAIRVGGLAMDNVDKTYGDSGFTTTGTLEERVITY